MMALHAHADNEAILVTMAEFLLMNKLVSRPSITSATKISFNEDSSICISEEYIFKSISKSVLFNKINKKLRERFKENMPLLYSELLILIDPLQQDEIISSLDLDIQRFIVSKNY
ncbi:hypothetical protein [Patiriisocius sp. Uisw_017]|jgi:hypothetical protein|uniref:hypothetical protein n=1 Tax=Patiriisocius sp. Uisw_017 TaxID=3230968 RepID=UPI0039EB489C